MFLSDVLPSRLGDGIVAGGVASTASNVATLGVFYPLVVVGRVLSHGYQSLLRSSAKL